MVSTDLVTDAYVRAELNRGKTWARSRGCPSGRSSIGVESEYAVATPGKAFSAPGAVLHAEDGERLAVLHPRIAVRDPHAHSLLAAEHGPDVRFGRGLDHRGRWIGTQELGAFDLENAGDGIDDFHGCALLSRLGSAMNTGIRRVVFAWYSSYGG